MQVSVGELAKMLNGEVVGDAGILLSTVAKIEEGQPGALSFLANVKYEPHIYETRSSAVLVNRTFHPTRPVNATMIRVDDAYSAFTILLEKFSGNAHIKKGIDSSAIIDPTAKLGNNISVGALTYISANATIGDNCIVYPQVYIGDHVKLGNDCILYPGVKIYHSCVIGDDVILHAGAVIGSDGFGFAPQPDRSFKKIPQTGNVVIEDHVEIGANTTVDRATMGSTIIRTGVKLDNLIQIAHNVEVGEHTVMAAQCGIAGSTKIGRYSMFGGQAGVVGHLNIPEGSNVGSQSGIINQIKGENAKWLGFPAIELTKMIRAYSIIKNLPELEKRLSSLEKAFASNQTEEK